MFLKYFYWQNFEQSAYNPIEVMYDYTVVLREKQEELERIREKLATQMKQMVDDEDDRIKRAVEEKEAMKAQEEEEKEVKRQKMINSIKEHRKEQVQLLNVRLL